MKPGILHYKENTGTCGRIDRRYFILKMQTVTMRFILDFAA